MSEELNVNVGDEVLYVPAISYSTIGIIATVTKVTPTGRIRIDKSDSQFNKYGWQIGSNTWGGIDYICILTPEKREEVLRRNKISKCLREFEKQKNELTFEQAVKILKILNEGKK